MEKTGSSVRRSPVHFVLAGLFVLGCLSVPLASGCSDLESRCEDICANLNECGTTQCDCSNNTDCANADEIVDYLEDCTAKPCDEQLECDSMGSCTGCLMDVPACQN